MPPRSLAEIVPALVRRSGAGRLAALADLVAAWDVLVAGTAAESCRPEKLTFPRGERGGATLTLAVASSAEALAVQHDQPRLVERINQHYGYPAVSRLALVHRPPRARRRGPGDAKGRPLTTTETAAVDHIVATVPDDQLRERLARLGRSLFRRAPPVARTSDGTGSEQ